MNFTPVERTEFSLREKRSEFVAVLMPVQNREAFQETLRRLRGKYATARHICWGLAIADGQGIQVGSSDAGEPSGSAGLPILNQLKKARVVNAVLFVVRYFGGIKLGKKGLAAVYSRAARGVLEKANLKPWIPRGVITISGPLEFYGDITRIITKFHGRILEDQSAETVTIVVELPCDQQEGLRAELEQNFGEQILTKKQNERVPNQGGY